ncbi:signal peptidase I [Aquibacillus sp. 3ASR75-11]|uniref:Signal peptidase I n=1 Tax=Terrihalobacillus insolitus TaxID=2950438 RepID=A0A9X3WUS4_9BACI|nr:signal peptidase I [Terrihalobacillus insolitus]MDC3412744.1 signal peptidase I [Terrihalobacillus insolitus]MDC3423779.1 signal peptidase I [Terrihalobacillus insolitus]
MSSHTNSEWIDWLKAIFIAIILAFILRTFLFSTSIVLGESMYPTLEDGERILFNKFVYLVDEPNRGDIVIIQRPNKNYVKRVIALPEETISVKDGALYINGEKYTQSFLEKQAIMRTGNFGPITVPPNSYFVMGDNRGISRDSRNGLGFIYKDEIVGRTEFIIYPIDEWDRTK